MRYVFVAPGSPAAVSGGYAYNREMAAALRGLGHDASFAEADSFEFDVGDGIAVIDGIAVPTIAARLQAARLRRTLALIHHPTALQTGQDDATREALKRLEREAYARFPRLIATSDATRDKLVGEFNVPADRITVVVPGTSEAPRSHGSGGESCRILSIGPLVPRKGHDILLSNLARLFDLDWHLTIVGSDQRDPDCAPRLRALAEELGITARVTFAGEASGDALDALWMQTDLFALATRFESHGMAIAEALKRGVPVAVTAGGAAGALVTPETGVAAPLDDEATYSKSLRRMIFDTDLRHAMADAAWVRGQTLPSWRSQADLFAQAAATL